MYCIADVRWYLIVNIHVHTNTIHVLPPKFLRYVTCFKKPVWKKMPCSSLVWFFGHVCVNMCILMSVHPPWTITQALACGQSLSPEASRGPVNTVLNHFSSLTSGKQFSSQILVIVCELFPHNISILCPISHTQK
jgi:hypothetical protein